MIEYVKKLGHVLGISKNVAGQAPNQMVIYRFQALDTFWSTDTQSEYVVNQYYNVRVGNTKLDKLVKNVWVPGKKVRIV